MTITDDVETLIKRKPRLKLTMDDISEMLFGKGAYPQRIERACQQLIAEGRLVRDGNGGPSSPYTYRVPLKRRI